MKRKIIVIDEELCNGCGLCVPDCPEGALQVIDGKARLVSDLFCDGLGACIGTCPEGAISIEEREALPYDERRVIENIIGHGENTVRAHLEHLRAHGETAYLETALKVLEEKGIVIEEKSTVIEQGPENGRQVEGGPEAAGTGCGGCPGAAAVDLSGIASGKPAGGHGPKKTPVFDGEIEAELRQWPVQLKLLNPGASYFDGADLLVAADCSPFAFADFHRKFVRGRIVIMFCPKLDPYIDEYVEKLAEIFRLHSIRSVTVLRMEVPCCGGVAAIVKKAVEIAGSDVEVEEVTVSIRGAVLSGRHGNG